MRRRSLFAAAVALCASGGAALPTHAGAATPRAKISLLATGGPTSVQRGSSISFTFTVTARQANAEKVTLVDPLPLSVTPVSVSATDGSCTLGQTVRCTLGTIAANGTANVAVTATAVTPGTAVNAGTLTATSPGGSAAAHASATVTIAPAATPVAPTAPPLISSPGGLGQVDQHTAVVQTVVGAAISPMTYRVQYGTSTRYGQTTPALLFQGGGGGSMLALLRGLKPATVYHYRAVAENGAGQSVAQDETFETLGRRRPALDAGFGLGAHRTAAMTATLEVPRGVTVPDACQGKLTFTLLGGSRALATRTVKLNALCQAKASAGVPGGAEGLKLEAAFAGNSSVLARTVTVATS